MASGPCPQPAWVGGQRLILGLSPLLLLSRAAANHSPEHPLKVAVGFAPSPRGAVALGHGADRAEPSGHMSLSVTGLPSNALCLGTGTGR